MQSQGHDLFVLQTTTETPELVFPVELIGHGNVNGNCLNGAECIDNTNGNENGNKNDGEGADGNYNGNCLAGKFYLTGLGVIFSCLYPFIGHLLYLVIAY